MADEPLKLNREMALDWMAKTGSGARKCVTHFRELGYQANENPVKYWARTAKDRGETRPKAAKRVASGKPVKGSTPARTKLHVADMGTRAQDRLLRIRDRLLTYMEGGTLPELEQLQKLLDDDDKAAPEDRLPKRERSLLERAVGQMAWSPRGCQAAMTALGILMDKTPDVMNYERRVENGGQDVEGPTIGGDEAADRLTDILSS